MENLEFSVENCGKPVENLWKFCLGNRVPVGDPWERSPLIPLANGRSPRSQLRTKPKLKAILSAKLPIFEGVVPSYDVYLQRDRSPSVNYPAGG
ncbi:MAG: hypothetical protein ACFCA4_19045 [Cyanophyceae cyanobacterium]